jgi:glycosyltransferase involved in cell wall biosynthesis
LVSVIIPNYNHAPFLKERIDSVLNQTYQDFEVVILDDCSIDGSKSIIEQYRENEKVSVIVYNEKNSGSTFKQWEKGLEYAKSEFIWIAESDDVADKNFLSTMVDLLIKNQEAVLATCRTAHIDEVGKVLGINQWPDALDENRWTVDFKSEGINEITGFLRFRNTIPNASAVVFRNNVDAAISALLEHDWRYNGDWFFWTTLLKKGLMLYSSKVLNYQRFHSQTTRSIKSFVDEKKRFKETVLLISALNGFIKQEPNWFDQRYKWIFDQLTTRVTSIDKLKPTYYLIGESTSFALVLFFENIKFYFSSLDKSFRFNGGAIKQKILRFFSRHLSSIE